MSVKTGTKLPSPGPRLLRARGHGSVQRKPLPLVPGSTTGVRKGLQVGKPSGRASN